MKTVENFPFFGPILMGLIEQKRDEIDRKERDCKNARADMTEMVGKYKIAASSNLETWEPQLVVLRSELDELEKVEKALETYSSFMEINARSAYKADPNRKPVYTETTNSLIKVKHSFVGNLNDENELNDED